MTDFPPLRLAVLSALSDLKDKLEADPDALAASPYDEETKNKLDKLLAPKIVTKTVEKEVRVAGVGRPSKDIALSEEDQKMVVEGIKEQLEALKAMGNGEGTALEVSEKIQIAKTKTALLDTLLKMQERQTSVLKQQQAMQTVIAIIEDFMSEEDREQIMARLDALR